MTGRSIEFADGTCIYDPATILRDRRRHYPWEIYDRLPNPTPDRLSVYDYLVTSSMNNRSINADRAVMFQNALGKLNLLFKKVRKDTKLSDICKCRKHPVLCSAKDLVMEICRMKGFALSSATKTLHRRLPDLIPMIDSYVANYYWKKRMRRGKAKSPDWFKDTYDNWSSIHDPVPYMRFIGWDMTNGNNMTVLKALAREHGVTPLRAFEASLFGWLAEPKYRKKK